MLHWCNCTGKRRKQTVENDIDPQTEGNTTDPPRRSFNPNEHIIEIKTKNGMADYLPVQWRIVWFRSECPNGTLETEPLQIDLDRETEEEGFAWNEEKRRSEKVIKRANGFALFRAVAKNGRGGIGTGTKSEKAASFPDFIEKAETGAQGRALAALGYGTQFVGDERDEGTDRIADAPVDRGNRQPRPHSTVSPSGAAASQKTNGMQPTIEGYITRLEHLGITWEEFKLTQLGQAADDSALDRKS